jgi:hypothetical protein
MLLNAQGKDVTKDVQRMKQEHPKHYRDGKAEILSPLREVLTPAHYERNGMFSIGARARLI